jgi:NMD protein affecting ribosome stability and mRNA decay
MESEQLIKELEALYVGQWLNMDMKHCPNCNQSFAPTLSGMFCDDCFLQLEKPGLETLKELSLED